MKDACGTELIALAGTVAVKISECLDTAEIITLLEFLGLLKHNLEVIKVRGLIRKLKTKSDEKNKF